MTINSEALELAVDLFTLGMQNECALSFDSCLTRAIMMQCEDGKGQVVSGVRSGSGGASLESKGSHDTNPFGHEVAKVMFPDKDRSEELERFVRYVIEEDFKLEHLQALTMIANCLNWSQDQLQLAKSDRGY